MFWCCRKFLEEKAKPMKEKPEIGLALSGGGVRGSAHAGVFKALEEHEVEITQVYGSSTGAMAGALYAAGYKPEEVLDSVGSGAESAKK